MAGKLTARGIESLSRRRGRYGDGDGLFLRVLDPDRRVYWTYRYTSTPGSAKHRSGRSLN
jgi:hypothetical protein